MFFSKYQIRMIKKNIPNSWNSIYKISWQGKNYNIYFEDTISISKYHILHLSTLMSFSSWMLVAIAVAVQLVHTVAQGTCICYDAGSHNPTGQGDCNTNQDCSNPIGYCRSSYGWDCDCHDPDPSPQCGGSPTPPGPSPGPTPGPTPGPSPGPSPGPTPTGCRSTIAAAHFTTSCQRSAFEQNGNCHVKVDPDRGAPCSPECCGVSPAPGPTPGPTPGPGPLPDWVSRYFFIFFCFFV